MTTPFLTRVRGPVSTAVLSTLLLFGSACQKDSALVEPTDPTRGPLFQSTSSLPHINNTNIALPVGVAAVLTASECSNNPGPFITFEGSVSLAGFGVRMIFRNNLKGTHEHVEESSVDVTVQPAGEEIVIPKQPVRGGTGGNPFIWVQFVDGEGNALTDEIFIGRCVQGPFPVNQALSTGAAGFAEFAVESCENSPGPFISFDSELTLTQGVTARIIFRNNDNPVGGPHEASETIDEVVLIAAGLNFTFPKQPVQGGVGGNPWISAQFLDGGGDALADETLLGRCVQLDKAVS